MKDFEKMDRLLRLIAEMQEMDAESDALDNLLEEPGMDELTEEELEMISAAGSSDFAEFIGMLENDPDKNGDQDETIVSSPSPIV